MKVKREGFRFYHYSKMWKMKVKLEDFRFYRCLKIWKMNVKSVYFRFHECSINVENEGKAGRF